MNVKKLIATAMMFSAFAVPKIDTDFKSYMDYRCITNTSSAQYKLQQEAETDENGLRTVDGYYMIAVGTYYSETVGDKFKVTLDSGESFRAVVGDIKDNSDTDRLNMYRPLTGGRGDMIEFIVDTKKLPKKVKTWGSVSALPEFSGNVKKIEKIEED